MVWGLAFTFNTNIMDIEKRSLSRLNNMSMISQPNRTWLDMAHRYTKVDDDDNRMPGNNVTCAKKLTIDKGKSVGERGKEH